MMTLMAPAVATAGRARGACVLNAWRDQMTDALEQISGLLHEAGETHHRVFRIVDGADDDWASWYADWLVSLSELPLLLGGKPVRSELTYLVVTSGNHDGEWLRIRYHGYHVTDVRSIAELERYIPLRELEADGLVRSD